MEATVASISKPKSSSVKLAFAVKRSRKVSRGDNLSSVGKAAKPETNFVKKPVADVSYELPN